MSLPSNFAQDVIAVETNCRRFLARRNLFRCISNDIADSVARKLARDGKKGEAAAKADFIQIPHGDFERNASGMPRIFR